jgi:hypothetical protein
VLFSKTNHAQQLVAVANNAFEDIGFERNPTTLTEQLRLVQWSKHFHLKTFLQEANILCKAAKINLQYDTFALCYDTKTKI